MAGPADVPEARLHDADIDARTAHPQQLIHAQHERDTAKRTNGMHEWTGAVIAAANAHPDARRS
ncbi:hypothetical protein ACIRP3_42385 [Streptomyces sp. NPDC101209]|uniref:hypothetical protein n=1 Tax=Streptomyces sp. NPDC101209 TaxID=3366129 RepID=UPI0038043869